MIYFSYNNILNVGYDYKIVRIQTFDTVDSLTV